MPGRVIGTRLPCCPGKDSRFTLKRKFDLPRNPWWVFYEPPGHDPIPADHAHDELVALVNAMKIEMAQSQGGPFSINEHAGINPYPPTSGALARFLTALRKQLPRGGRFRVNEHGRAFTSNGIIFVGTIPRTDWFRPLTARS